MSPTEAPPAPPAAATWVLRFSLAFALLNTLLTFENRWPGFGVLYMPRLSFELCLVAVALMAWVGWRGVPSRRAHGVLAAGFMALVVARYANVTAPAVLGRPVNLYWDGRHAADLLSAAAQALPAWQVAAGAAALVLGLLALWWLVRAALVSLSQSLVCRRPRPWLLATAGALTISFAAYVPDQRDTRWFFSLPITPSLARQGMLLAQVWLPGQTRAALGESPGFAGDLSGLVTPQGTADVLLVFAESYGASTFDQPVQAQALQASRAVLDDAIHVSGRAVVSARVVAPTFGGASWLSHAALLSGVDTSDPADHDLLLTSQRPTLVSHFARHGYRTVGWMPGLKRPWPEGAFYGFDRLADDPDSRLRRPGLSASGAFRTRRPWRCCMSQELDRRAPEHDQSSPVRGVPHHEHSRALSAAGAFRGRLVAPHRARVPTALPKRASRPGRARGPGGADHAPVSSKSLNYQNIWMADYLRRHRAARPFVMVIVGDHQAPALASGARARSWDVPVHVITDRPGIAASPDGAAASCPALTRRPRPARAHDRSSRACLLQAFDAPARLTIQPHAEQLAMPPSSHPAHVRSGQLNIMRVEPLVIPRTPS